MYKQRHNYYFIVKLWLYSFFFFLACGGHSSKSVHIDFNEQSQIYHIKNNKFQVHINKTTGECTLSNPTGETYTTFPLSAQFQNSTFNWEETTLNCNCTAQKATLTYQLASRPLQKVILEFHNEGFEVKFGVKRPLSNETGIYCFKKGDTGLIQKRWDKTFTPEADDYYSEQPIIDVCAHRDNMWIFSPAPFNLSVQTTAGWFSMGLANLAPITRMGIKNRGLWFDYPWQKLPESSDEFYWLEPIVFTFPVSEWNGIATYRNYLETREYLAAQEKRLEKWWSQPILSTWGEQQVQKLTPKNKGYTSAWVKDYIQQQMKNYKGVSFTILIEKQWQELLGDARPDVRFADLKTLIQWCHQQGHKVVLWWKAWRADANSLAQQMQITDGDFVDATHPDFKTYAKHCCAMMLSSADTALNADGIKIDEVFRLRDPQNANYADSTCGLGLLELKAYLQIFYEEAKRIKPDAMIMGASPNPHFADFQDMVSINEDWDNKLRREKRAIIITQAVPGMLIDGKGADMSGKIALYHYLTSAVYGIPNFEYLSRFPDAPIDTTTFKTLNHIISFYQQKGAGLADFIDYGWWQWRRDKKTILESIAKGTALLFYDGNSKGLLYSTLDQDIPFVLEKKRLLWIKDEKGNEMSVRKTGQAVYILKNAKQNQTYQMKFRTLIE